MENKTLNLVLNVLAFAIGIVGLFLSIRIMAGYEDVISTALWLVYILMIVAGGVAILFGLVGLFTNLRRNIPLLIGLVGFVVIALIAYNVASDEVLRSYSQDITPRTSQLSGMGIIVMYVMLIIAVITAILGEVMRLFK